MTQPEVILTPQAREDIKQIATYIKEDSPQSSLAFRQTLENIYEVLLESREMGTARNFHNPEMKGLRMLPVRKFTKYLSSTAQLQKDLRLSVSYTARGIFRLYFIKTTHSSVRGYREDNKIGFWVDGLDEGEPLIMPVRML